MVVAKSINGNNKQILLKAGKVPTNPIIQKLEKLNLKGIFIKDDISTEIKVKSVILDNLQDKAIAKMEDINIESCLKIAIKIVNKIQKNKELIYDFVALKQYEYTTSTHSVNVAIHAAAMGMAIGFSQEQAKEIALVGLLHDIGKIKISLDILNKNDTLTEDEYISIKKHPQIAYDLLKDNTHILSQVRVAILQHHENEDGTGYPLALKSHQICEYAKLIHIIDVYEALISSRPYKKAYNPEKAISIMMNEQKKYDEYYFAKFLTHMPFYPRGTMVRLYNYKTGIVIENNKYQSRLPIVRMPDKSEIDLSKNNMIEIIDIL